MTMSPVLTSLTIAEASRSIAAGELSPAELTETYLARIAERNAALNAFITVTADAARRAAHSEQRGVLAGIPIALKDLFDTRGVRTTAGSAFFADRVPDADSAVTESLARAGAVPLGKTNMHEWALGVTSDNPHFGPCRNPWALDRITGGSSGGSAAALAAGLCAGAMGSDTGGSIRIPASLCGIVGLKPTYGRVSLRGAVPLSWTLDHAGPMARNVADVALMLTAIAGYDAADPSSADVPVDDYLSDLEDGVQGWAVAAANDATLGELDPDVRSAFAAACAAFESLGARVTPIDLPRFREAASTNALLVVADGAAFHRDRLKAQPERFGADVLARLQRGASATAVDYALARRAQVAIAHQYRALFAAYGGAYDVVLTPTTPITAPVREGLDAVTMAPRLTRFTAPFNLMGLPALSMPCGLSGEGLPIGLQIVAAPWREAALLRAARAYERAAPAVTGPPARPASP
jgi:aspartyl-tRNA(Asn)/glutamyl-tRNA(Gln) amidotransferase subunit A